MACSNSCNTNTKPNCNNGSGYVCIVVLYILLAIIIGSFIAW